MVSPASRLGIFCMPVSLRVFTVMGLVGGSGWPLSVAGGDPSVTGVVAAGVGWRREEEAVIRLEERGGGSDQMGEERRRQ